MNDTPIKILLIEDSQGDARLIRQRPDQGKDENDDDDGHEHRTCSLLKGAPLRSDRGGHRADPQDTDRRGMPSA